MKKNYRIRLVWILTGTISLVWFLIRVIPKPLRATYPCQRAAFPLASSFIIWLGSLMLSLNFLVGAKRLFRNNRFVSGMVLILFATVLFAVGKQYDKLWAGVTNSVSEKSFTPTDPANTPMGESYGIFPGRVVWYHNPEATSWDGSTGNFWDNKNTSINEVNKMFSESIDAVTGATSNWDSWQMLFTDFNVRKARGNRGYLAGEKIAIKLNLSNSDTQGSIYHNRGMTSPQVVITLIRQLVNQAEVPDTCITLFDVSQKIPAIIFDPIHSEFPGVKFVDTKGGNGRNLYQKDGATELVWSENLVLEDGGGNPTYLPKCVTQADYIINIGILKGHDMAGISLCGKNHVGTLISANPQRPELTSPRAAGIHPYATVHYFAYWNLEERPMGSYNTIVDLMGHQDLGNKTLLFIVDGLYASKAQNGEKSTPNKWFMAPFTNDWPSSIFISQDNVALESVCLDFLRSEPTMENVYGNVDNYLHEAALANDPPSGTFYDPENDGVAMKSLGFHEHWNNADEKLYKGNTFPDEGIQLLQLGNFSVEDLAFSKPPGEYENSVVIEISTPTGQTKIYYTLDGSYPDESKNLYQGGIVLKNSAIINARAFRDYYEPSELISGSYTIRKSTNVVWNERKKPIIYPTRVESNIYIKTQMGESVNVAIFDLNGRVLEQYETLNVSQELWTVNVNGLKSGFYLIKVKSGDRYFTQKFYKN